jgi:transcription elongation factor Elf1
MQTGERAAWLVTPPALAKRMFLRNLVGFPCPECGPRGYWRVLHDAPLAHLAVACVNCENIWTLPVEESVQEV